MKAFAKDFEHLTKNDRYELLSLADGGVVAQCQHGEVRQCIGVIGVERVHTKLGNRYKLVRVDDGG